MTPLLTFYGDDFTGSTAVMEILSFAGVPTMLFMDAPEPEVLSQYPDLQAIGVAGIARSKDPAWMRANLPPVFEALKRFGAPVSHYKTCSTFDSAPGTGSIGVASELGARVFDGGWIPLVVGAPAIRRYQAFGNLFAGAGADNHRLDRHPVMSRHPVTPMDEADLGRHLSRQTDLRVGVIDLAAIKAGQADAVLQRCLAEGARILAIDVVDDETLAEAGRLTWQDGAGPVFAVGSQGVEYALVAFWRAQAMIPADHAPPNLHAVDQIFAVSGSCAPTTADQIACAEAKGFKILHFDAACAADPQRLTAEMQRVRSASLALLSDGHDVLATTARGPDDPALGRMAETIEQTGASASDVNDRLGAALGQLVAAIRQQTGLPRVAIGGGDTSGHALTALGAEALTAVAPLAPGAPVCRLHKRADAKIDGLEVTLKGGQMGAPEFFLQAKGCPQT
ncbi:four-carbon acid sugar kinase family protein (plasmid) [Rhodobacteraceae bacterium SC52]|nr:four-carbon acid sugar kinase family protein [Rhodobacteraceae bacterium SC52]